MATPSPSGSAEVEATAENLESSALMRWLSGTVAVFAACTGAVAVFTTENQVGTAALLAIGAYFAITTLIGRFPKLKLGENEIDPSEFRAFKTTIVATTTGLAETKDRLQEAKAETDEKIGQIESEVSDLNERVARAFLSSMSEPMWHNLAKLGSGRFGQYVMGKALDRELRYLRDVGYIDVRSVAQIPPEGDNLSDWVEVTPTGHDFIALRKEIARTDAH
ncbi:hypothetical protein SAMN04244553_1367 [Nocardia amikacinitolerans]|uniref:Uncharacterized protein n=1 Tax=Nocardia amikacinitolerans TaxID=756689 RepID=A0A285L506_9NOCA|nr:hypothetical protein [Nocardia amikacinitolerans]SNY78706.1 hypothetical protein SAMN04244553_1367 [Nocardia amikacinitolerans]